MVRKTFRVLGMHCPNCAMSLEGLEDELPGVRSASASYARGELTIEFDESMLGEAEISGAVARLGYRLQSA